MRNVDFKPELRFLNEIKRSVSFEKSHYATASVNYTAEELWQKVAAFLTKNQYITCRMMRAEFGLTRYKATLWLNRPSLGISATFYFPS